MRTSKKMKERRGESSYNQKIKEDFRKRMEVSRTSTGKYERHRKRKQNDTNGKSER